MRDINLNTMEIPEIPEIPPPILKAASNGKLVVFIGAGVSRLLGYPSWQNLAEKYVEYLFREGKLSYLEYEYLRKLDPRKLLSICKNFCKKRKISEPSMRELLSPSKKNKETIKDIYELIYSWNVIYVTTNFDDELDKVVEKEPNKELITENNAPSSNSSLSENRNMKIISNPEQVSILHLYFPGQVIHLHGSVNSEEEKLILTISDYLSHYQNEEIQLFLNHLFTRFTVLFIGYGLEEYELLEFLVHKSQAHTSNKEIKHYLLYPLFSWEQDMLKFYQLYYRDLKIEIIPCKKDKRGYEQLYEIIKAWTLEIKEAVQPAGYSEIFKLIDEVLG